MLSPEYLWSVSDSVVNEYDELNKWAVKDMAERIMAAELYDYDKLPGTARYRAWMLNQAGMHYDEMSKKVAEITKKSEADIMKLFIEAGLTAIANDFEPFDKEPYDIRQDKKATQLLQSAYEKTNGELHNYTRTTMDHNQKLMIDTLDKAYFDVSTGAKSYSEAIKESIDTVSKKSCTVEYPDSGHVDSIETAVRRAVMTGVNQGTSKISLLNCEKLGTDYVIVSAHEGARYNEKNKVANHLGWQGGVYKIHGTGTYSNEKKGIINAIKRFLSKIGFTLKGDFIPNLEEETGFPSNPLGLCGYNCRHSFYPFLPEIDDPKKYKHIVTDVAESKKAYDLSQKQRTKEREIRKLKSDLIAYQTAIDNCPDEYTKFELQLEYDKTAARLQKRNKAYREFCQENDLQMESERIKVAKWNREQSYQATRGAKRYNTVSKNKLSTNRSNVSYDTSKEYVGNVEDRKPMDVVKGLENGIRKEPVENAYVIQKDGDIYKFVGQDDSVNVFDVDFEGAIITHNHPSANGIVSFGHDDFQFLKEHQNLAELRVVNEEYTYYTKVLKKLDDVVYNDIYIAGFNHINGKDNVDVQHCAFLELKKRGYVEYVRRKVKKD